MGWWSRTQREIFLEGPQSHHPEAEKQPGPYSLALSFQGTGRWWDGRVTPFFQSPLIYHSSRQSLPSLWLEQTSGNLPLPTSLLFPEVTSPVPASFLPHHHHPNSLGLGRSFQMGPPAFLPHSNQLLTLRQLYMKF